MENDQFSTGGSRPLALDDIMPMKVLNLPPFLVFQKNFSNSLKFWLIDWVTFFPLSPMHKRGKWPIFFRWIQTPGFRCFNAYEGSKSFYSAKTTQKPAIFDKFWILLDKKWIRKCLELVASPIFFLYSVPTQNVVLNRN